MYGTSSLTCGKTIVDSSASLQLLLDSSKGAQLNLGNVYLADGSILKVGFTSAPGSSSRRSSSQTVTLMSYDSIQGGFSGVEVSKAYPASECDVIQVRLVQGVTDLQAVIEVKGNLSPPVK